MKLQDQRTIEVLEAQMPEFSEEHKDESCSCQPYRTPAVFLVGKANRLIAGYQHGTDYDTYGQYYHFSSI